ncbi:Zinc finger BED domain-containing protein DAYSLEEPER [Rhynchospora pubera]|uniref:Zinc finger BED domain-containing protein DAYSLEEPER n=1 Tax=Rhynchospora pubera TaxID=906938 RepID=A0AAV8HQU0_9POAL|nr:Zinc finger BED domain-containing protein DAYSLEEPER [Rhynchospora pubera]
MSLFDHPSNDIEAVVGESESRSDMAEIISNRGKKRSVVWEHFDEIRGQKVVCKHCDSSLTKQKNSGTSHLKRHLAFSCKKIANEEREKIIASQVDDLFDPATFKFDPQLSRGLQTLFFIDAEIPFSATESRFWEPAMRSLRPEFRTIGRQTMRDDCVAVFKAGCDAILTEFEELDSRVSFTSDIWTSSASLGYMCVTAHWIDKEFRFQKKIIALKQIPYPHTGQAVANLMEKIWDDWKLGDKIFALTLDNSSVNDNAVRNLENKLREKIPFGAIHMHMRCSAHILNLIVQDGMDIINTALKNIRDLLRHITSSGSRLQVLNTILDELKLPRKRGLTLDCSTRWNSTFLMVKEALGLKTALLKYVEVSSTMVGPSAEEWSDAEAMANFLEPFLDATKSFSNVRRPSSHTYIKEIWDIRRLLLDEDHRGNANLEGLALQMQAKFCKYWENPNLILTIATFFDPRYKFIFLKFCYHKAYGDEYEAKLNDVFTWLKRFYEEYESSMRNTARASSGSSSRVGLQVSGKRKLDEEFAQFTSENRDFHSTMSELDKYMQEALLDINTKNFDILEFWKKNSGLYPTLAKMARDFLAVQTSSVASESAFSASGRLTDHLRTSMNSETIEALVCAKDWFGPKDEEFDLSKYLHLIPRS